MKLIYYTYIAILITLTSTDSLAGNNPSSMPQNVIWQMTINRVDSSPQPSGFRIGYRVQMQCSGLSENEAYNTVLRFPAQEYTYFSLPIQHPAIESFALDEATNEWVMYFQDVIYAGTNIEFDIIAHSANHITPNGNTFIIDGRLESDNADTVTASSTGEWESAANLGIKKYLQYGPDTDAILDVPVKYYLYPCDPSFVHQALGHLYLENWILVDQLPEGTVYNGSSGTYNPTDHSVTWADTDYIKNEDCDFKGATDYWVEVTFPSTVFGSTATPPVLQATNTASFQAYPVGLGGDAPSLLSDTESIQHNFAPPNPVGGTSKTSSTPYVGIQDLTYEGDSAKYFITVRTSSSGSLPYYFKIIEPLPCLDHTPGGSTQYASPGPNDPVCSNMAYQPTDYIGLGLVYDYLNMADPADFVQAHPTIPIELVTTNGDTVSMDATYAYDYYGQLQYRASWADIQAFLGVGVGVSSVIWDSETIGIQVKVTPDNNAQAAVLSLYGSVAEDTPAYPMLDQYQVRNEAYFFMKYLDTVDSLGPRQAYVSIIEKGPIVEMTKDVDEPTGLVNLEVRSTGGSFKPSDSLIVTDLLPLGYTYGNEAQQFFALEGGNWYWAPGTGFGTGNSNSSIYPELDAISVKNYIDVEIIDDYDSTGRQLVKITFLPPPVPDIWKTMKVIKFSFHVEQIPMNYAAVNYFQVFPTNPTSAANLKYQFGFSSYPTQPSTNDINDLDGDGITTGDSFGQDFDVILPLNTVVDTRSFQAVKGDSTTEFDPFPAVADITDQGGTADFQINIRNEGGVGLQDMVVYDILPHIGDVGLSETQVNNPRGSAFDVTFTGIDMSTLPTGTIVEYSTSTNPCRNELTTGATPFPAACTDDWTTTIPSPIGNVEALRFTFPSGDISQFEPGESFAIEYGVSYPAGVQPGDVAWNNFAYTANRMDDLTSTLPTEVPKVGIAIPEVDLALTKSVNPVTNFVGDAAQYTITVDHEGDVSTDGIYTFPVGNARNVILMDDFLAQGLTIVPGSSTINNTVTNSDEGATFNEADGTITLAEIGPTDTYEITYYAYANTESAITNTVEVMSHPGVSDVDSSPGNGVSTEDDYSQATAYWQQPNVQIQTLVETYSGSGIFIEADATDGLSGIYTAGQPVNYQFVITNTGSSFLTNLSLVDSLVGFECNQTIGSLATGATSIINCTWQYGFADDPNPYVNVATITGEANIGSIRQDVFDMDSAQVVICNLNIATTGIDPVCENGGNGNITITATTGGTAPYTISWTGPTNGNMAGQNLPYVINNLKAGGYDITVTDNNGCTDQSSFTLDNTACAFIGDYVWIDENQNGLQDGEPGLSGITVTLLNTSGQIMASTSTDAQGHYQFDNLTPGDYQVQVTPPSNYVFTNMGIGSNDDSDINPATGMTNVITLTSGNDNSDVDAGLIYNTANNTTIGDFVWLDDGNGIQDASEPGMSGVIVTLYNTDGSIAAITQTDGSGYYGFTDTSPGDYYIGFTAPVGYNFTTQTNNTSTGSDASPLTGETGAFTVGATSIANIDAGFTAQSEDEMSLGGSVWVDTDNNGIQDANEVGNAGITVHLYTAAGVLQATTTTNILGDYTFNGLAAGDYYVEFDISSQGGYGFVTPDAGSNDALDSDVNNANGPSTTATVTLVAGVSDMSLDAGIHNPAAPTSSVGDYLWYDDNADGVQDADEVGVPGIAIFLYDDTGTVISTTMTDKDGFYLFPNLADGDYGIILGNLPQNHVFSPFNSPSASSYDTDSDADAFGNMVATVSGGDNLGADAGIYMTITENATGSIGNMVFYDYNSNGIQDDNEIGIGQVEVYLYEISDLVNPISTVFTDGQGNYVFNDLPEAKYIVGFGLPSGDYEFTTSDAGNDDTKDSDIVSVNGLVGTTDYIELTAGEDELSVDAGIRNTVNTGAIGDFVWFDGNFNATHDSDEIGVGGVTVTLFDNTGAFLSSASTNPEGYYAFHGLADGDYTIKFSNFPAGMSLALQTTNTANGSDPNSITGLTNTITVPSSGTSFITDIDAGLMGFVAALGDYIWYDANMDGLQDADEEGIHGATVTATQSNGTTVSAVTDENGYYSFPNLPVDSYTLSVATLPGGLVPTVEGTGAFPDTDSNVDPVSGSINSISLSGGEANSAADAGYVTPLKGSLGNYAWFDNATTDGLQETDERGVPGMTIQIYDSAGTPKGVTVTDADGYYLFNNLPSDDYSIEVITVPKDYVLTYQDASSTEDGMDSDGDRDLNTTADYTVNGKHLRNIDIGIAKLNIQGFAWYDTDNDGYRTVSEVLLEGVEVKLYLLDSTLVDSAVTNSAGFYEFLEMDENDYFISFSELNNTGGFAFVSGTKPGMNGNPDITDEDDSDMHPYDRRTADFNLRLGETKRNIDAGFVTVPLPVELIYFEGVNEECDNVLYWATATEENNSHFIVEVSIDGKDFQALGYVEGNGNSTERIDYSFTHASIRKKYNYYRLKQVDFDGTSTYTETVTLEADCGLISNAGIMIYPNPTLGNVYLEIYSAIDGKTELAIVDATGRVIEEMTLKLNAGITIKEIDMSGFKYGVYMFSIKVNGSESLMKVIKAD